MSERLVTVRRELMRRVRQAFFAHGYAGLSMVELAKACGVTRRTLYNHFSSKEEAFRASVRHSNIEAVFVGMQAGERVRQDGGTAVDIFTEILDVRYGETRREVQGSAHTVELNAVAFMKCRDIMIEFALSFQRELEHLIVSLAADGMLDLRDEFTPADIAQTLANGARGVNQSLPPPRSDDLVGRYRQMCQAVLYGCARAQAERAEAAQPRRRTLRAAG